MRTLINALEKITLQDKIDYDIYEPNFVNFTFFSTFLHCVRTNSIIKNETSTKFIKKLNLSLQRMLHICRV